MSEIQTALFYFAVVALVAMLARLSEEGERKTGLVFSTAMLVMVSGFRAYTVGTDTSGYWEGIQYFFNYGELMWNHTFSIPYAWITSGVLHIFDNYTFLLVIEAIITNGLFAMRLWDYKSEVSLSFAMFAYAATVFPLSLCLTCQMLAVSIAFYAVRFLDLKKPLAFMCLLVIAALVHVSAVIVVLAFAHYAFKEDDSGKRSHVAIKLFSAMALFAVGVYASMKLIDRYGRYSVNEGSIGLMVFTQVIIFLFALLASGNNKGAARGTNEVGLTRWKLSERPMFLYIVGLALSASSYVIANAGRIAYYFTIFGPIVFGSLVKDASKSKSRFVLGVFLGIWFLFYAWYAYLLHTGLGIEQYAFIWSM